MKDHNPTVEDVTLNVDSHDRAVGQTRYRLAILEDAIENYAIYTQDYRASA